MNNVLNLSEKEIKIYKLACAILSYEMDAPHTENEVDPLYPDISIKDFLEFLSQDHYGDCINQACTCVRCVAEDVLFKANFIINKLSEMNEDNK